MPALGRAFPGSLAAGIYQRTPAGLLVPVDASSAVDGDVVTWNPDLFSAGVGGYELRTPSAGGGGSGAPTDAHYVTTQAETGLSAEQVLADSTTVAANVSGGTVQLYVPDAAITGAKLSSTIALPSGATAITQSAGDNSTKLATTGFVTNAITSAGGVSPAAVDFDRPSTPNAADDEFESTTRDPKWTQTLTGAPTINIHTTHKSCFYVRHTAASQGVTLRQSVANAAGTPASFSLGGHCLFNTATASYTMLLLDAAETNGVMIQYAYVSGTHRIRCHHLTSGSWTFDFVSAVITGIDSTTLRLERTAANLWTYGYSHLRRGWQGIAQVSKAFAVAKVDIGTDSNAQSLPLIISFDFFRKDWGPIVW